MKSITIYYGPKKGFNKVIPAEKASLSEIVAEHDNQAKVFKHVFVKEGEIVEDVPVMKKRHENVVAYSEQYAGITESAVQSFLSVLDSYEIENLFLQNPPLQIKVQLQQTYPNIINERHFSYKKLSKKMLLEINDKFDENIIGQEKVKKRLLAALYPLLQKSNKRKPIVLMFYGKSGVGKTETAKFISKVLGQPLFRKQFSMFHSGEFQGYLFGGTHSQASFARDLLERESNVLLLDEFDKPHPVFHSAFYQLFDEGIFEDKNYQLSLYNSIIICTSNYLTEEEIKKNLGDPIFYRFDKFIKFDDLSVDAICKIIDIQLENRCSKLSPEELGVIDRSYISARMKAVANKIQNVRQITKIVDEYISMQLIDNLIKTETQLTNADGHSILGGL